MLMMEMLQKRVVHTLKPLLHVETFSSNLCATVLQNKFHEVVLQSETLVFSPLRLLRAVAEVGSGSTFLETCLATEVQKKFHETDHVTWCNPC